jgi:type I restriction enzyme, S subunit
MQPNLLLQQFESLADTPDAVPKLRALILQLATTGRLVPQSNEDDSATILLKKIDAERNRLVAQKKLDPSPRMKTRDKPTAVLPAGWAWSPFGRVTFCRDGERIPVSSAEKNGLAKTYDYYGASGVIDKIDRYLFDKPLLLIGEDGANLVNRSTPIAFIARGRYWVNNHAHVLDGIDEALLDYLRVFINSIDLKPYLTGMAQPKMNQAQMNSIPVALPPLPEQRRIVAKVEQLLALCDQLEARQTTALTTGAHLLDATLHQVLQFRSQ